MLIIAGQLEVEEADRDSYVSDCHGVVEQARAAAGCLDFSISADPLDPKRVNIYERWESDDLLEEFRGSGPDAGTARRIRHASVRKYRISATEDP